MYGDQKMQYFGYLFGAIATFVAIFLVASPERFFKPQSKSKKIVGPSYWGNYIDSQTENTEHTRIESVIYPSKDQAIVGSETYARGWGVKE
jgi:hypothetical protein